MSSMTEERAQKRPRTRKSIASIPSTEPSTLTNEAPKPTRSASDDLVFSFGQNESSKGSKKSRSKSLGPGGIDALRETTGNRRKVGYDMSSLFEVCPRLTFAQSVAALPKSILKPTIPLSPLKEIPSRKPTSSYASPTRSSAQKDLRNQSPSPTKARPQSPFKPAAPLQGDSEDQTIALSQPMETHEQAQKRRAEKERIVKQREERRKSMAARRVSFAPEATLHTWDVVEYVQDSTTSSSSTNSTRRASEISQAGTSDAQGSPTTPLEGGPTTQVEGTPDDTKRKKARRSSGIPPMNFNDPGTLSSSPFSQNSGADDEDKQDEASNPDESDQDEDGDASMDLTAASVHYPKLPAMENYVDAALEQAADHAGTKQMEYNENGDVSMEINGDDPSTAFRPRIQQSTGAASPHPRGAKAISATDQENVNPFSPQFALQRDQDVGSPEASSVGDEMSMDMTRPMGRILSEDSRASGARRKSTLRQRQSIAQLDADEGTMAMDMTTAFGGINSLGQTDAASPCDENEEMSMEFTSIFGGGLWNKANEVSVQERDETSSADGDVDMEMTTALGVIVGRSHALSHSNTDSPEAVAELASRRRSSAGRRQSFTTATGSPAHRRESAQSVNSPGTSNPGTPVKLPSTPSKQVTPQPVRPQTPSKTPPSANVSMRHPSPKMLFRREMAGRSPFNTSDKLFSRDGTGQETPKVILAPQSRMQSRNSDVAAGTLGSPLAAELLDRRASIGAQAQVFSLQAPESRGVRFENPREMDAEVSRERAEDSRRESGQYILEQEAENEPDKENATQTLRDMMQSMTPKKKPSKIAGRKSLHVGAAKGLLGKRPAELDEDERHSPEVVKGREGSPVKKIKLQAPPTKSETTRRQSRRSLATISGNEQPHTPPSSSPGKPKTASTPRSQGRFKDAEKLPDAQKPIQTFGEQSVEDGRMDKEDNIQLQDFLNMTSIRFMELNTTKRRQTQAQTKGTTTGVDAFHNKDAQEQFEESVVAGACTLPMLELFQHSCRELKKYISEGRDIVKEIEVDTFEENPPLFKEYLSATPATRGQMDNQFKNIKTHARHLSKGMWYEWRMKLLEGLRHGLDGTANDMKDDIAVVEEWEQHLDQYLPLLAEKKQVMEDEHERLRTRASEFHDSDPHELDDTRKRLQALTDEVHRKRELLDERQRAISQSSAAIDAAQSTKTKCQKSIKQAQGQREANRGWSLRDVKKLRSRTTTIEESTGWAITSALGTTLTMTYRSEVQLFFDAAAFAQAVDSQKRNSGAANSPISLMYVADEVKRPLTTQKRFFLQIMRAHLQSLVQSQVTAKDLLSFVSEGWTTALSVVSEIHRLDLVAPSRCRIVADERMDINTEILLPQTESKLNIALEIRVGITSGRMSARMENAAVKCMYGESFKEGKMKEFVESNLGKCGEGTWGAVVVELRRKLAARGKK